MKTFCVCDVLTGAKAEPPPPFPSKWMGGADFCFLITKIKGTSCRLFFIQRLYFLNIFLKWKFDLMCFS